jgi:hypothetical protein
MLHDLRPRDVQVKVKGSSDIPDVCMSQTQISDENHPIRVPLADQTRSIPVHLRRSLQDIYLKTYHRELSDSEANALGWALIDLFGSILSVRTREF